MIWNWSDPAPVGCQAVSALTPENRRSIEVISYLTNERRCLLVVATAWSGIRPQSQPRAVPHATHHLIEICAAVWVPN
jgi:hypothetical protein